MSESNLIATDATQMRVLTVKQPFASLFFHNKIETREWYTRYRGPVLIHAALKPFNAIELVEMCSTEQLNFIAALYKKTPSLHRLCGHAIAVGDLVDCRDLKPADQDRAFIEYLPGLYGWVFENVRPIEPIPMRGSQGFRNLNPEEIQKIIFKPQLHECTP